MTTSTARANAARKQAERDRLAPLLLAWGELYARNPKAPVSEFLALGGTPIELHAFAVMIEKQGNV